MKGIKVDVIWQPSSSRDDRGGDAEAALMISRRLHHVKH